MNETLANTNDAIKNQQQTIMKKVKERCEFLANDFALFKKNLFEENSFKQKIVDETIVEMKEQVLNCVKFVDTAPSFEEITQEINEKNLNLRQTIFNEIRDTQVRPVFDRVSTELKIANE